MRRAAAIALCAVVLSACSVRGADLGTTSSPCFHALPTARAAVQGRGRLVGVRLVPGAKLRARSPEGAFRGVRKVCLVAYQGSFDSGRVLSPVGTRSGPFAVVVVTVDGSRVLGTLVLDHLPLPFRHTI